MSNTYSLEQQIHSLSLLTNVAFGQKFAQPTGGPCATPNAYSNLQSFVSTTVTKVLTQDQASGGSNYLGSSGNAWQCVWGPVVYSNNPNSNEVVADNTLALYYNNNNYVVGIAGTNSVSSFGWLDEDFAVGNTVPWSQVVPATKAPAKAAISSGAQVGLQILLSLKDKNNTNQTLVQYLQSKLSAANSGANVYVAGHSLGGALTHILALYLYETAASWNTGNAVTGITAYPTAGPTITNDVLTQYYEGILTAKSAPAFTYIAKINTLDIVPMAWALDTLSGAPFIYDGFSDYKKYQVTPSDSMVAMMTTAAIMKSYHVNGLLSSFNNYTQIWSSGSVAMTGNYEPLASIVTTEQWFGINLIPTAFTNNSILKKSQLASNYPQYLRNFIMFFIEAIYQHTTAYSDLLLISGFADELAAIKKSIIGSEDGALQSHVVLVNDFLNKLVGEGTLEALAVQQEATETTAVV